jgi:hypothetical protein
MNSSLARIAVLFVLVSGCGGVETGSSGKSLDATIADVDGPDTTQDGGPGDAATFCPGSGCFDTGAGSWCMPGEFCASTGSQPTCPMACCSRDDAGGFVNCRP